MFKVILALLWVVMVVLPSAAYPAEVGFSWLPSPELSLAGYKIHYGADTRLYTESVDVGIPDTVEGRVQAFIPLNGGQRYFVAATAYSTEAESDYSDEVDYTVPMLPPEGFQTSGTIVIININ